jgi:hypothetical protein
VVKGKIIIKAVNEKQSIIDLMSSSNKLNFSIKNKEDNEMVNYRICKDTNEGSEKFWVYHVDLSKEVVVVNFLGKVLFSKKYYSYSNDKAKETILSKCNLVLTQFFKELFGEVELSKRFILFERENIGNFYMRNVAKLDEIKKKFKDGLIKYEEVGEVVENKNSKLKTYKFYEKKVS